MKQQHLGIIILIVLAVVLVIGILLFQKNKSPLIKECPDEWIENRMPGVEGDSSNRQYFIFDNERKETKNYDLEWIKSSCSVQVQPVY